MVPIIEQTSGVSRSDVTGSSRLTMLKMTRLLSI